MTNQMQVGRGKSLIAMSLAGVAALAVVVPGSGQGAKGSDRLRPGRHHRRRFRERDGQGGGPGDGRRLRRSPTQHLPFPSTSLFADDGDIFVVDRDVFGGTGGIRRLESTTGVQTAVSSNSISAGVGGKELMQEPGHRIYGAGDSLFVADYSPPRKIIEVDIATGKQSLVTKAGGLASPFGIIAAGGAKLLAQPRGPSAYHDNKGRGARHRGQREHRRAGRRSAGRASSSFPQTPRADRLVENVWSRTATPSRSRVPSSR